MGHVREKRYPSHAHGTHELCAAQRARAIRSDGHLQQSRVAGRTTPPPETSASLRRIQPSASGPTSGRANKISTSEWNSRRYSTHTTLHEAAKNAHGDTNQATTAKAW